MAEVEVRIAHKGDAQDIIEIYSPYVLGYATTFETEVPELKEMEERIMHYLEKYPWLVCAVDGKVIGYVYASAYKERLAYQWSCECSVYLSVAYQGKGIARELYSVLFSIIKDQGFRTLIAGITLPNPASVKLHEGFGFHLLAVYENIGYKLGAWQNVGWWRLRLNDYNGEPSPPLLFSKMNHRLLTNRFKAAAKNIHVMLN